MYLPPLFEEKDLSVLREAVRLIGLGTLVTFREGDLEVSHVPMLLDEQEDGSLRLLGHLSRNNPQFLPNAPDNRALAMFVGPNAYVSPRWYPGTSESGRTVPTWNYQAVHVHGPIRFFEETERIIELLAYQTRQQESSRACPWSMNEAPDDHIHSMAKNVVGFEIPVERIEGKWKMSQYASLADRQGAIDGLRTENRESATALAVIMEGHLQR
ncbi:FMN-binding negative transcriptional regulator [Pseudomonas sp. dw_612]|uniref:FMN-binding negative transcriptional regulator n=1 Tax=Pseudomonas sp. dw_612 TaxID=2720080 RepID=UPI001BD39796|nr:FMN-binding negative transcriptional regulator [Pseudomonas sp. dw_612]